jgi:hypothetical protein
MGRAVGSKAADHATQRTNMTVNQNIVTSLDGLQAVADFIAMAAQALQEWLLHLIRTLDSGTFDDFLVLLTSIVQSQELSASICGVDSTGGTVWNRGNK